MCENFNLFVICVIFGRVVGKKTKIKISSHFERIKKKNSFVHSILHLT